MLYRVLTILGLSLCAGRVNAHASEQGFVLLLPTDVYIISGASSVALTIILLAFLPKRTTHFIFSPVLQWQTLRFPFRHLASLLSTVLLGTLVWQGFTGPRDPLANPMPLFVWTVWWIVLVSLQGLIGNLWSWTNPWTGIGFFLKRLTGSRAPLRYPRRIGYLPGIVIILLFAAFLLADPAPADPARLATFVGIYWYVALIGLVLFGPVWIVRGEAITILMRAYAKMGAVGRSRGKMSLGLPGWQIAKSPLPPLGLAIFILILLGSGSFDGLNETFWWLDVIGINPLEFPGRTAVTIQTLAGLVLANTALIAGFTACLWMGERIAGSQRSLRHAFCLFAPSILPIALGYHIAHYLTTLLVDGQYVLRFFNDPFFRDANLLGLSEVYVTTGFFNTPGTVKVIWLTQAGAVVAGHVIAILLAHSTALKDQARTNRALLGQAPLAIFMVAYTFFGLWLLASPRGF